MQSSLKIVLAFLVLYFFLGLSLKSTCSGDPTSLFFDAQRAHTPIYSEKRIQQAVQFADNTEPPSGNQTSPPQMCVGIASIRREGISYLKSTLGSLLHGLSGEERNSLHTVVLLAHLDQTEHPDYGQQWLGSLADGLPSYSDSPERQALAEAMGTQGHSIKAKFDYSLVMEECYNTGAQYILMIEDDVVFMDGWLHRTMEALDTARIKTLSRRDNSKFLYLRLFYYEGLLGWNAESWPKYVAWSLTAMMSVLGFMLLLRWAVPQTRLYLGRPVLALVTFIFVPLLILLYFAAGANCMLCQPSGVHLMPEYACCGQGLVFPRVAVGDELLPRFQSERWNQLPTDSFIEWHAETTGGLRWALTPVVMQHIGGKSSHGVARDAYGIMTPTHIWNVGFEQNDVSSLANEHREMDREDIKF
ncbi:hypothetical protein B0I35DRAFT_445729 [Stachybotrys elegans]|uniref:Integral membrane protein n=1 Tax=Stachybotrys elegans TaxID=80388 RepID=A0A8K0SE35_9HYPO|nr:hypothetical protein B0I35DRAFT_445729 [Stachybotrys elegans]